MKILITGGNGDIAQAIAKNLRNVGHQVLAPDRILLNVTDEINVKTHFSHYRPDVLINAAGAIVPQDIVLSSTAGWEHQINVNLIGTYLCSKYALEAGARQIINIGSSAGAQGKASWSAYCAAKAGVERFTESLHEEGHHATCLRIGRAKTKMREELFGKEDPITLLAPKEIADWVQEVINFREDYSGFILAISADMTTLIPENRHRALFPDSHLHQVYIEEK